MNCLRSLGRWDRGFESHLRHEFLVRVCIYSMFVLPWMSWKSLWKNLSYISTYRLMFYGVILILQQEKLKWTLGMSIGLRVAFQLQKIPPCLFVHDPRCNSDRVNRLQQGRFSNLESLHERIVTRTLRRYIISVCSTLLYSQWIFQHI
jgi:hypothetical protein